jgi:hypothetical protein
MKTTIGLSLLLSFVCTAAHAEFVPGCAQPMMFNRQDNVEIFPQQLPARDYLDVIKDCFIATGLPYKFDRPESLWLASERAAFTSALAKQKVDVLVAPFQVQGYGLERTERALMSADLAYQLGGSVRVADPFLVARALGEGARRYERNDVIRLAHTLGARTALIGYVGHDRAHHMTVTIETVTLDANKPGWVTGSAQKDWLAVPFTDANPPFAVFHGMLPSIVKDVGFVAAEKTGTKKPAAFPSSASFSLADLATGKTAIGASAALDLLGAMASSTDELARERLFARALVASWHFDAPGDATAFARAYALFGLEHRPAALEALKGASQPEAVTLRALLNGNSAEARQTLAAVDNLLVRLLLALKVDDLRFIYQEDKAPKTSSAEAFGGAAIDWKMLVGARADDGDPWGVDNVGDLKYLLDTVFPVEGLGVESVVGGNLILRKPADDVTVSLANIRHVSRFLESAAVPACCTGRSAGPSSWDLVGLIEGRNIARIAKSLHRTVSVQASYPKADADLARYSEVLSGHPVIAAADMDYAWAMAGKVEAAALETWRSRAIKSATIAAYFANGQSPLASRATSVLGFNDANSTLFLDAYGFDYPRRAFWMEWMFQSTRQPKGSYESTLDALRREAAVYASADFGPYNRLVAAAATPEDRATLAAELQGRFVGTPGQKFLLGKLQPATAQAATDPIEEARTILAADPDNWAARFQLGSSIVERGGKYEEVSELFLAHPSFHAKSPPKRVELSNDAARAADLFFLNGHEDLAGPFFGISAGLNTGSNASLTSEVRLDILAGRYRKAADESLARAQRYPNPYAYRDYLSFLHAFDRSDEAWSAFSQVASAFDIGEVWVSALVGQRREGLSESQIREWLSRPGIRDAKFRGQRFAMRYAVLVNAADHEPPRDLGALVEQIEGEPTAWIDTEGYLARTSPSDPTGVQLNPPSSFKTEKPRPPSGTRVKSEFAYFGAAYAAIQRGDPAKAVEELKTMATYYPIESPDFSYAIPYFAWAAAKTGDKAELEKYVMTQGGDDVRVRFDFFLARAFFAGIKQKDSARARELLANSLPGHPNTDNRPVLVEYQYAQACEWLYKETKDQGFRDMLLAWVKSEQRVHPTMAWAYAMEYAYAPTAERRLRALAMTLYLDPKSERIASATADDRRAAEAWGKAHNPFLNDGGATGVSGVAAVAPE